MCPLDRACFHRFTASLKAIIATLTSGCVAYLPARWLTEAGANCRPPPSATCAPQAALVSRDLRMLHLSAAPSLLRRD